MVSVGAIKGTIELDDKFSSKMSLVADTMDTVAKRADVVGKNLSLYLTAPIVGLGVAATKTFMDFEGAMKGVEAALNPTADQLKRLETAAVEWGAKTQFSATESARALGELGKAGFDVEQSIQTLPNVLDLATVAGMDLAEAATLTSDTLKQFNLSVNDAGRVNDVLAQGAQKSTADVQQLAQAMKFVGPVAAGMNISFEETVAILAEFHNVGLKADMAGTSLRNVLTDLASPTKGMKDGMAALNIETFKSTDGTFKLAEVIDVLREKTLGTMSAVDRTALIMQMFGDRGGVAMTAVVNKGSEGMRVLNKETENAGGAAARVSKIMTEGLGGSLERMKGSLETAGSALGSLLAPAIIVVADKIGALADFVLTTVVPAFQALPTSVQSIIGIFLVLAAGAGPLILVLSKVATGLATIAGTGAAKAATTALFNLGNTVPVLTARLWLLEAGQKAVGGGLGNLASGFGKLVISGGGANVFLLAAIGMYKTAADGIEKYAKETDRAVGQTLIMHAAQKLLGREAQSFTEAWNVVNADVERARKQYGGLTGDYEVLGKALKSNNVHLTEQAKKSAELSGQARLLSETIGKQAETEEGLNSVMSGTISLNKELDKTGLRVVDMQTNTVRSLTKNLAAGEKWNDVLISTKGELVKLLPPTVKLTDEWDKAQVAVKALTAQQISQITAGQSLGRSSEEIAKAINGMNIGAKVTAQTIDLFKNSQKEATKSGKDWQAVLKEQQETLLDVSDSIRTVAEVADKANETWLKSELELADKSTEAVLKMLDAKLDAEKNTARIVRELTLDEFELKVDTLMREGEERKKLFQGATGLAVQTREAIDREVETGIQSLIMKTKEFQDVMSTLAILIPAVYGPLGILGKEINEDLTKTVKKTSDWRENLSALATSLGNLGDSIGGAFGGVLDTLGNIVNLMDVGAKAGESFKAGMQAAMAPGVKNWGGILTNITTGLMGGIGSVMQATSTTSTLKNVIGGALSGAVFGAAVASGMTAAITGSMTAGAAAGPWGAAAGAIVGIFIGVFRGREARREMKIIGNEWGGAISQGMYDKIEATADTEGLGRVEAALLNMSEMISELGGLNALNFGELIGRLRDVFVSLEVGAFTAEQALFVLNENFATFAQHVVDSGRIASEAFTEIIRLNAESGLFAQEVLDFVGERMTFIGENLSAMTGPLLADIEKWKKNITDAQGEVDKLTKDGKEGTEEWLKAQEKLTQAIADANEFVAKSAEEVEDLGTIAVGAFGAARKAGLSFFEAAKQMDAGLAAVTAAQRELGIVSENTALQELTHFHERITANATLVQAAEGLSDQMLGLSQIGALNADTLKAMEDQGVRTFERLIDAGFTENEALSVMKDFLANVIDAHIELGIPVDENLAGLIDLADQYGVLEEGARSFEDIFKDGVDNLVLAINALIETMGGVPAVVEDIGRAIDDLPDRVPVDVEFNVPRVDLGREAGLPGYQRGTGGIKDFGDGTHVILHGREAVFTEDQLKSMYGRVQGGDSSGLMTGGTRVVVNNDFRGADVGSYVNQQQFVRKIREAMSNAMDPQRYAGSVGPR